MNLINSAPHRGWSSRPFVGTQDLLHMQHLLVEGRSLTDDWHYPHLGDLNFWFFMVQCHLDPAQFIHLWRDVNGTLIGYAILGEDPSFDCQVLPGYEWRGIEAEALAWADSHLAELRRQEASRWGGGFVSGSRVDNATRIAFLKEHGFNPGGEFSEVNLICDLQSDLPAAQVPEGFQVRSFAGDTELSSRAAAQRDVWQPWTVGYITDQDYAALMQLPGYDRYLDVVAVAPDGVIAAYVNGWIDPLNRIGDFGPVGALPEYRRMGLARAVLLECLHRMQERGMQRVSVSTGISNEPARRLYESVGFTIVNEYQEYVRSPQV